jgi:hypothetical protein
MSITDVCPSCQGKMLMYYVPYCPACIPKAKVKKNLIQSIHYIEHKYKLKTRDYAAAKHGVDGSSTTFNFNNAEAWKESFSPIPAEYVKDPLPQRRFNQAGMDWYDTSAGREFFRKRDEAYAKAPDGKAKEIPYQDWWHLVCDLYEFSNDSWIVINWQDLYDSCDEDWQREITKLFIAEFGKRDIRIEISW